MKRAPRKKYFFGKYGIKGNSGLTGQKEGVVHISANYDSNKGYFVDDDSGWRRVRKQKGRKPPKNAIRCALCNSYAVSLDHHYPYMSDMNRCKKHYGK